MSNGPHFRLDYLDGGLSLYLIAPGKYFQVLRLWPASAVPPQYSLDIRLHSALYTYDCVGTSEEVLVQIRAMFDDPEFARVIEEISHRG